MLGLMLLVRTQEVQGQYGYVTNADGSSYAYSTNADGTLAIDDYSGPPWVVTIPTKINGLNVSVISGGSFAENTNLSSVTIPGTVGTIGYSAFFSCPNLTNATLSNGVTNMLAGAFGECYSLSSMTFPCSLTSIGEFAFDLDTNLSSIAIPNGEANIAYAAFWHCTSLSSVMIPATVVSIGDEAFFGCTNISAIMVDPENSMYSSLGGVLFDKTQRSILAYPNARNGAYTIPNNVGVIEEFSFAGSLLTCMTIPASVTNIGEGAFFLCNSLTNVTIPGSVAVLGYGMFASCANLQSVFFESDAPTNIVAGSDLFPIQLFFGDATTTAYYLPGTTGWTNTYQGVPAVQWNPLIQTGNGNFGVRNNQFGFDIKGTAAIPIVVEGCTNLANPVWTALTNVTLTNGLFHFSEPAQANSAGRFYRISSP